MLYTIKGTLQTLGIAAFLGLAGMLFGEEADQADTAVQPGVTLPEFRSIITIGNETHYSLRDPETGVSFWISEHEIVNGIEVVDFRAEGNSLTIYLGDEIHELTLSPSNIAELSEPTPETRRGRPSREERRERYRDFLTNWQEATESSETLGQLDREMRALASEFRETRSARRQADRGTDERESLQNQERAISREIRLMAEYTALQAAQTPAFQEQGAGEIDQMSRMLRGAAFRRSR